MVFSKKAILFFLVRRESLKSYSYPALVEYIYNYHLSVLLKMPIEMFFLGIIEGSANSLEEAIETLNNAKEAIIDVLSYPGIEVDFTDQDFNNLTIVENKDWAGKLPSPYGLQGTNKAYLFSFFEDYSDYA